MTTNDAGQAAAIYAKLYHDEREKSAQLRAENQRLLGILQLVVAIHDYSDLDRGIGTATTEGMAWLAARNAITAALAGEDGPEFLKEPGGSPITEEWLQSTGIYVAHGSPKVFRCSLPENRWGLGLIDIQRDATRSTVLALLAALGVR